MAKKLIFSARKKDFRRENFRCGGPGGQNQNKRYTGVRYTHIASGLAAECREHRTQEQNRKAAFRKLCDKLVDHFVREDDKERYAAGDEVVRSYHEPNDRVTDHATGQIYSYRHTVGKGDLSRLIHDRRIALEGGG